MYCLKCQNFKLDCQNSEKIKWNCLNAFQYTNYELPMEVDGIASSVALEKEHIALLSEQCCSRKEHIALC